VQGEDVGKVKPCLTWRRHAAKGKDKHGDTNLRDIDGLYIQPIYIGIPGTTETKRNKSK
jgi:hypothetical protein